MKFNDRIFWIGTLVILVCNKAFEMIQSFDMAIDPITTTAKVLVMFGLAIELTRILLPKAKKAC